MRSMTINKIQDLLLDPESPELSLMMDFVHTVHANLEAEHFKDDSDWFNGLTSNSKTKSHAMRESAKQRVRGYLSKTKDYANTTVSFFNQRGLISTVSNVEH